MHWGTKRCIGMDNDDVVEWTQKVEGEEIGRCLWADLKHVMIHECRKDGEGGEHGEGGKHCEGGEDGAGDEDGESGKN
eukprot:11376553-Karenia_brevis.AAC.1